MTHRDRERRGRPAATFLAMPLLFGACGDDNAGSSETEPTTGATSSAGTSASSQTGGSSGATSGVGSDGTTTVTGSGGTEGTAGGTVIDGAFFTSIPSGRQSDGGNEGFSITAQPDGGFAAAFEHSEEITLAGETVTGSNFAVVRIDPQGQPQWLASVSGDDELDFGGIASDADGAVYVAGKTFSSTVNFGDGVTLDTGGGPASHAFVAKYDDTGTAAWAQAVSTSMGINRNTVAAAGDTVVISGYHLGGGPVFYQGPEGTVSAPDFLGFQARVYVLYLDKTTGAATWLARFANSADRETALGALDAHADGSVTLGMNFYTGTLQDDQGNDVVTVPADGMRNAIVAQLGPAGAVAWTRVLPATTGEVVIGDLSRGADGSVAVGGSLTGTADFGEGPLGDGDPWVVSLSGEDGTTRWSQTWSAGASRVPRAITVGADGEVLVAALASEDAPPSMIGDVPFAGGPSAYVLSFGPDGVATWVHEIAFTPGALAMGRIATANGVVAIAGSFNGTISFWPGQDATAATDNDAFLLGLEPTPSP